jgi:hypothetical protein
LKGKNKLVLKKKFKLTSNEKKIIITKLLYNIKKKVRQFISSSLYEKKNLIREKKSKMAKKKFGNIWLLSRTQ